MTSTVTHYGNDALALAAAEAFKRPKRRRCNAGHDLTPANRISDGRCRTCHADRQRERNARIRDEKERERAKIAADTRSLDRFIAARRERGIPEEGITA